MEVYGKAIIKVDVSPKEAAKIVIKQLGYARDRIVLEANDGRNKTGKRGLFEYYDTSYHGSASYKYDLISDHPVDIENYLLGKKLDSIEF